MLTAKQNLKEILFLDIKTVAIVDSFFELSSKMQELFKLRFKKELEQWEEDMFALETEYKTYLEQLWNDKAAFHPEFAKVASIAWGGFTDIADEYKFRSKYICNNNEIEILTTFAEVLKKITNGKNSFNMFLCAHNGKTFDFPFLAKRMIINRVELPTMLDYSELKPWDCAFLIDTREAWRYGVFDANYSLDLICAVLGVESPKTDMHGSKVKEVFYKGDYEKIGVYCNADVLALATCYLRMKGIYNNVIKEVK